MNLYELIDDLYHAHSYLRAGDDREWPYMPVRQMLDAYLSLAPDWGRAPDWAAWYIIENGWGIWCDGEPLTRSDGRMGWNYKNVMRTAIRNSYHVPEGIDQRLCKWQRQQPLSTHNNSLSDQEPTP